jgi:RHS repeat-associated protein
MVTIERMGAAMKRAIRWFTAAAVAAGVAAPAAASTITYYHNDLAGSPVVATNSSAQVIWRESYRPYGERLTKSASAKGNDVWFTSRREDATGLVYMGARYYDPVTGRFVSIDPKQFDEANVQSFNRYAYANDNPLRFLDRDGRAPTPVDAAFVLYDVAKLGYEWSTGGNVRGAAVDLGISAGAVLIPLPGAALAIKAERAAEAARAVEEAAIAEGKASRYIDKTEGSSVANRATNVSREEFEKSLAESGWERSVSQNGKVSIFQKDGAKYTVRDFSKEGSKTAEYFRSGSDEASLKIRLEN